MNNELEQLRYSEALSDFGSIIIEHGARKVAHDLLETYPAQTYEFYKAIENKDRPVAALLRKDNAASKL